MTAVTGSLGPEEGRTGTRLDPEARSDVASRAHAPNDNFAFLRLLAAFMVLASHQASAMGRGEWTLFDDRSSGGYGVLVFFVVSGYLVCKSWQDDPHAFRFVLRRLLRVWPGLAFAVVVTVFVIGPVLTTLPMRAYWSNGLTWHYFVLWRFELAGKLPGVFESNPIPFVNASLWTIPIELRWYWILTILGVVRIVRFRYLLLAGTVALAIHYFLIFDVESALAHGGSRRWKEEFGLFFLAGACLHRFRDVWVPRRFHVLPLVALAAFGVFLIGQRQAGVWLILPIGVIAAGRASWPFVRRFDRLGDLSYGTYMYAFPIQQAFVALSANGLSYAAGFGLSAILTLALAALSWHLVEAPCLALKPRREGVVAYGRRLTGRLERETPAR